MALSLENVYVRLSDQGKDQLIRLKRITGIKNWNVLCRWALCLSLADQSPPLVREVQTDSNVEMSWRTFTGSAGAEYAALLNHRLESTDEGFTNTYALFVAHLHRGIGQLAGTLETGIGIEGLIDLALGHDQST